MCLVAATLFAGAPGQAHTQDSPASGESHAAMMAESQAVAMGHGHVHGAQSTQPDQVHCAMCEVDGATPCALSLCQPVVLYGLLPMSPPLTGFRIVAPSVHRHPGIVLDLLSPPPRRAL
ncbi:hypothetical protein [Salipiger thiooxidans]|uniref:hypothetical protein n=1 Tax=Salipiger thiooxidans TaxID=282683 RepID=UPI001CD7DCD6|nr:hypothetical protein [Salipiger thiooxidans]MCA0849033.1 hypothetical protein [Salipiger thiooxidans]